MKQHLGAAIILLVILLAPAVGNTEPVILVADTWCPYNCTPNSEMPGFMVDIADTALKSAGYQIEYKVVPWARALEDTRTGKYAGVIGAAKDDAPDFIYPEGIGIRSGNGFYVQTGSTWKFNQISDLKDQTLGAILDYAYHDDLDLYIKENRNDSKRVQLVSGERANDQNVKKLLAGRVTVLVEDHRVMDFYLQQNQLTTKVTLVGSMPGNDVYIAFSPGNPKSREYAEILSKYMKKIAANGELESILARYGSRKSN